MDARLEAAASWTGQAAIFLLGPEDASAAGHARRAADTAPRRHCLAERARRRRHLADASVAIIRPTQGAVFEFEGFATSTEATPPFLLKSMSKCRVTRSPAGLPRRSHLNRQQRSDRRSPSHLALLRTWQPEHLAWRPTGLRQRSQSPSLAFFMKVARPKRESRWHNGGVHARLPIDCR